MNYVINSCLTALNGIGRGFCSYATGIFVQSSVLIVLLLIIDFLLRKRVRAVFRYCVWMLVFVKLILPPTLSLPTGIGYWYGDYLSINSPVLQQVSNVVRPEHAGASAPEDFALAAEIAKGQPSPINPQTAAPVTSAVSGLNALTWQAFVFLLWLLGVLVISVLLIQRMLFVKGLIAQSAPAKNRLLDMLNQCRRQVGIGRNIELRLSNSISSPAVCGLFKPVILIPAALVEKLSPDRLRAVLVHELVHIKRADIWVNLVQTVLQIIYFYNPFVWLANAVVRRVREQAVDEMVLVALGAGAKDYSNTLIDIAEMAFWKTSLSLRLIGVVESKKALHRRIKHMLNRPIPKNARVGVLGTIVIIIIAAVLLPMAKAQKLNKAEMPVSSGGDTGERTVDKSSVAAARPATVLAVRRVWAGAADPYFMGAPSPDGKYLTYVDWTTGDLAVRELATGKNRRLTNEGWDKGFASNSVFSPDGKQVAYYWFNYEEGAEQQGPELRIVGLDGSGPRVIRLNKGRFVEMPAGWSADGKHILALGGTEDKSSQQILLIPVEGGDVRVLNPAVGRKVRMTLSPDGRYVAYSFLPSDDSPNRDISVVATDGSGEIPLVEHPADDFVLGWAPDGKRLVFASDRTGSMGVWAVEVADGKTQGDPQLLKPEIGRFYPLGMTRAGSYYYGVFSRGSNIYVAAFDPQKGNVTGEPTLAIQRNWGSNWAPTWSPDGRYLACVSSNPDAGPEHRLAPPYHFLIRSMETGEVRELSPELTNFDVRSLSWFPDGRSLLGAGKTKKDVRSGILKIDVETGNATTIGTRGGRSPNSTPDGKTIFDVHGGRKGWAIYRHDLTAGDKKVVFKAAVGQHGVGAILGLALSPDAKHLAFQDLDAGMLKILSVAGGQPRELVKFEGKATITWAPDGSHLLYANWLSEPPAEIWRIPVEGGEPRKVDLEMANLDHVRFHPNGRQITFMGKAEGDKIEVWVMENFLPAEWASGR